MRREPLCKVDNCRLGGAVGGDPCQWPQRAHRGDIDDATLLMLRHRAPKDLAAEECALEVAAQDGGDARLIEGEEWLLGSGRCARRVTACGVHQDIHRAERRLSCVARSL